MNLNGFVRVAGTSDIAEGRGKKIELGDQEIALWRVNGRFYAISNVCAHQHISAIHLGTLEGLTVSCPMHGWAYSLETGRTPSGEGKLRVFRVVVEKNQVYVELPGPTW
jgi:nitrite reductase/ring-hydroxylating ferredoxin subunit